jgi:CRISPR-associated protein Cas1
MRTVFLDRKGMVIGWEQGTLTLRAAGDAPRRLPVRGLERLIVASSCTVSSGALSMLWERGVAVTFLGGRRGEAGPRLAGAPHNDARIRLRQFAILSDPASRSEWACALVGVRLRQMRRVALVLARRRQRGRAMLAPALAAIGRAEARLAADPPRTLDSLRGVEGAAVAAWFGAYADLFPPALGFTARRRRPPPDAVNAALSLGYTLATAEAAREAVIAGFDPAIGIVHGLAHGREALALDLVEPARPHVDRMVHDLFHSRRLTERHVTREPDGAVLLGKAGRAAFYSAWEAEAAPVIRPLLRGLCRMAVRRLRMSPPGAAESAAEWAGVGEPS